MRQNGNWKNIIFCQTKYFEQNHRPVTRETQQLLHNNYSGKLADLGK